MYALITFIVPRLWWVVLISGIVWEIYESQALGCQDFLDIFWDSLGIFLGYTAAMKFKKNIKHVDTAKSYNFKDLHNTVKPPESVKSESVKSESVKSESVKSESVKSESVKSESVKSESVKNSPQHHAESHVNLESCIVYDYTS